jgi:hypothetical protein
MKSKKVIESWILCAVCGSQGLYGWLVLTYIGLGTSKRSPDRSRLKD